MVISGQNNAETAALKTFCDTLLKNPVKAAKSNPAVVKSICDAFDMLAHVTKGGGTVHFGDMDISLETARSEMPLLSKVAKKFAEAHLVDDVQGKNMTDAIDLAIKKGSRVPGAVQEMRDAKNAILLNTRAPADVTGDSALAIELKRAITKEMGRERDEVKKHEKNLKAEQVKKKAMLGLAGVGVGLVATGVGLASQALEQL